MHIIGFIITGFIVGLLARALKPGNDRMSLGLTTLLGMAGAFLAGFIGRAVGWYGPDEPVGFFVATIGAIAVLAIYYATTNRRSLV